MVAFLSPGCRGKFNGSLRLSGLPRAASIDPSGGHLGAHSGRARERHVAFGRELFLIDRMDVGLNYCMSLRLSHAVSENTRDYLAEQRSQAQLFN